MASATRIPSAAAEVMPPAYPQPSPQGYTPAMPTACRSLPRTMRTGEDVRDSTPGFEVVLARDDMRLYRITAIDD